MAARKTRASVTVRTGVCRPNGLDQLPGSAVLNGVSDQPAESWRELPSSRDSVTGWTKGWSLEELLYN